MNILSNYRFCSVAALATLVAGVGLGGAIAAPPTRAGGREIVQVLTRGPMRETLAQTVAFDPEPGIVVAKSPLASIEELPPDLVKTRKELVNGTALLWVMIAWLTCELRSVYDGKFRLEPWI